MAQSRAAKGGKMIVWIILLLLFVGLAGFGSRNFGGSVQSIGKVGDTEIPVSQYSNALEQRLRDMQQQTGQQITLSQAKAFGLDRAVLGQVVGTAALKNEADRIGLSVGDEAVREQIVSIQAFQGPDGTFDREAYRFALDRAGQSVKEFEASVRADVARSVLQGAVVGGVVTPGVLTDTLYTYARETRDITWAALTPDDLAEPLAEPDDAALKAYYDDHEDAYTLPERRRITYAWLTPKMVADTIEVSDSDLKDLYQARIDQYVRPERRLVERLVYGTEDEAQAAADAIAAGETTFDAEVEKRGLTLDDVDLGDVSKDALGGAAGEAVFAMDAPGVTGPVQTDLGPALFRMNGILDAQETPFEKVRPDLLAELRSQRARDAVAERLGDLEDRLAGGATLEDLAKETEMQLGEMLWTPDSTEGPAADPAFNEAAAKAAEGDFPELTDLSDGGVFALRLDEVIAPELQPFDQVKATVTSDWIKAETQKQLEAQAQDIADSLAQGGSLADAGLAPKTVTELGRDAPIDGAPQALSAAVFEMEKGETRVVPTPDGAAIVTLDAVTLPDGGTEEAKQLKQRFAEQTARGYAQDMMDSFTRALETRAGVQLNQSAIEAVHSQFP